ncbi:translocation protein SEC62-like isoform X2 [Mizuhopecten yessoensis]|uniref:translocation protein SEC62-like isoform X2 n=1 Tax=Mizuhopecten yessoensis TaxID=6573 RepID=UPI000B45AC92|nr:translocation protein SEC62-like isoform X2 [Mizuhopecten yessoensis]
MADKRRTRKRTEKENEKPCSKEEYSIAKHLRFNCQSRDAKFIPMGTVVKTFVASDAIDLLLKSKWAKPSKSDILLSDRKSCEKFCERLLQKGLFHRALKLERRKDKVLDKKKKKKKAEEVENEEEKDKKTTKKKSKKDKAIEEKETDEKEEDKSEDKSKQEDKKDEEKKKDDEKKKKERKLKVDMHDDQIFLDGSDVYVWIYDPVPAKTFVIGLLMVVGAAALCVFPLWPDELRVGVYYCSLAGASFVGFILFLVLVRFLLFCVIWTVTVGKIHFWFLPNLTEDVGFFDSFKPLYKCDIYNGKEEEDDIKKKKKDKKQDKEKEVMEKQEAQEQGFELVQKEDVEENIDESEKKISEDEKEVDEDEEINEDEEEDIDEEEDVDEHEYESKKEK